jgi:hypothetical protein
MVKEWQTRDDFVAGGRASHDLVSTRTTGPWRDPENLRRVDIKAGYFATLRRPPLVNSREKNCGRRTSFSSSVISARGPPSPTPYSWSSFRAPPWADEKPGAVSRIASRVYLPDLRTHKKTDLGQARDRGTLREFQFPEYYDSITASRDWMKRLRGREPRSASSALGP